MGLYKELQYALVDLAKQQTQIYPDAADVGVLMPEGSTLGDKVKELLTHEMFGGSFKKHRTEHRTPHFVYVTVVFNIPWEPVDYSAGFYRCSEWTIHYINDIRRKVRFLQFSEANVTKQESEIYGA